MPILVGSKPYQMTPAVTVALTPVPVGTAPVSARHPVPIPDSYEVVLHKASLTFNKNIREPGQPNGHDVICLFMHDGRHANVLRLAQAKQALNALEKVRVQQAAASATLGGAVGAALGSALGAAKDYAVKGAVAGPTGALVGAVVGASLCLGRTLWNQHGNSKTLKATEEMLEVYRLFDRIIKNELGYGELINKLVAIEAKKDERAKSSMLAFREMERNLLALLDDWHRDAMLEYNIRKNALDIARMHENKKAS